MKHELLREMVPLAAYGELEPDEQELFDAHVAECSACRSDLDALLKIRSTGAGPRLKVTESLLQEARLELRAALRNERNRVTIWSRIGEILDTYLTGWMKLTAGATALVAAGFLGGYLVFQTDAPAAGPILKQVADNTEILRGEAEIMNVRFDDADPADGQIAFRFDVVSPVQIKGDPNDPGIQSVLTKALMYEQNPGVRLRAVNAIASQIRAEGSRVVDEDVKRALLSAMRSDGNPGVRKEALQALRKFPFDEEIKEGLLFVLTRDLNEGLRVEAINSLATAKNEIRSSDEQLLETLRRRSENDNNQYVRLRARAVFEEVKQQ